MRVGASGRAWVAPALLVPILAACGTRASTERGPARSVLLVTLDTTRADHLGCYGYPLDVTPRIDALARRGVLFEIVYAPMGQTLPSHSTLMTGTSPRLHGALENHYTLRADTVTLAEVLSREGYRTGAFVGADVLASVTGIAQGFEVYGQPSRPVRAARDRPVERPAAAVVDEALAWFATLGSDERFFAWVHFFDPHGPLKPPEHALDAIPLEELRAKVLEPRREELAGTDQPWEEIESTWRAYAAEILATDEQLGRLLDELKAAGRLLDTVVVVTADHGQGLFEHGERGHGLYLYEETVRVPLIVALPDGRHAGRRERAPATLEDVFPTLLHLAGQDEVQVEGRDLWPALDGSGAPDPRAIFLERPHFSADLLASKQGRFRGGADEYGIMTAVVLEDEKLIRGPGDEVRLYDLSRDPAERIDLAEREPERVDALRAKLDEWLALRPVAPPGTHPDVSSDRLQALRELGYAGD